MATPTSWLLMRTLGSHSYLHLHHTFSHQENWVGSTLKECPEIDHFSPLGHQCPNSEPISFDLDCYNYRPICLLLHLNLSPDSHIQSILGSRGCIPDAPGETCIHLEWKQRSPLCSRVATGISGSSLGGLKVVKPPEAFGERIKLFRTQESPMYLPLLRQL